MRNMARKRREEETAQANEVAENLDVQAEQTECPCEEPGQCEKCPETGSDAKEPQVLGDLTFAGLPIGVKHIVTGWLCVGLGVKNHKILFGRKRSYTDADGTRYGFEPRGKSVLVRVTSGGGDPTYYERQRVTVESNLQAEEAGVRAHIENLSQCRLRHAEFYENLERKGQQPDPRQASFFAAEIETYERPLAVAKAKVARLQAELAKIIEPPAATEAAYIIDEHLQVRRV